ncbi:FtsB family cell division protein [Latilactobacillus graminis]|uniref:Septum formation initiator family protein n=1 Tax=Latilactobacillus graminis TaxID=60519 RepID=A0ABX6C9B1_9LACO|nr:septum formation initiator family protein [Latilactobacillus graminis]QFP79081.1 septum formation initiator family protein [Latilactobacillus graminis]
MSRKITKIENAFTQQQAAQRVMQNQADHVNHVHQRRLWILGIVAILVVLICGVQILQAHRSLAEIKETAATKEKTLKKAKTTESDLKIQVKQLQDSNYLAKYIRYKYYYSKDGETIFSLPQDKAPNLNQQQK